MLPEGSSYKCPLFYLMSVFKKCDSVESTSRIEVTERTRTLSKSSVVIVSAVTHAQPLGY